jgi:hypothetical protein
LVLEHEVGTALVFGDVVDEEALFGAVLVDEGQGLYFAVGFFDLLSLIVLRQAPPLRVEVIL